MTSSQPLHGLVAATHTPFHADGSLNLAVIEKQAAHMLKNGVKIVFIGGTTGESSSLTLAERLALGVRWCEVARGSELRVVVHAGANSIEDSKALAADAQRHGACAVAALAPSYFKPRNAADLVACCTPIAAAAPGLPFYYYDIPSMTGVNVPVPEFLSAANGKIANLAGAKFTNADLMTYQLCLQADGGRWDVPYGMDEAMLAALALGARGSVGSSFNFAAPIYHRLIAAFDRGDLATARGEQFRSVRLIKLLASHGYMAAAKSVMKMLGVDVGPPRLPIPGLADERKLRGELDALGFSGWIE